jgi:hypothetical protein
LVQRSPTLNAQRSAARERRAGKALGAAWPRPRRLAMKGGHENDTDADSALGEGLVLEGADGDPKEHAPTFKQDVMLIWPVLAAIALQTFGFDIINSKLPILLTTEFARTTFLEMLPVLVYFTKKAIRQLLRDLL